MTAEHGTFPTGRERVPRLPGEGVGRLRIGNSPLGSSFQGAEGGFPPRGGQPAAEGNRRSRNTPVGEHVRQAASEPNGRTPTGGGQPPAENSRPGGNGRSGEGGTAPQEVGKRLRQIGNALTGAAEARSQPASSGESSAIPAEGGPPAARGEQPPAEKPPTTEGGTPAAGGEEPHPHHRLGELYRGDLTDAELQQRAATDPAARDALALREIARGALIAPRVDPTATTYVKELLEKAPGEPKEGEEDAHRRLSDIIRRREEGAARAEEERTKGREENAAGLPRRRRGKEDLSLFGIERDSEQGERRPDETPSAPEQPPQPTREEPPQT